MKVSYFLAGLLLATSSAMAQIGPDASGFGAIPAATFNGSGIPNTAMAQTTQDNVTLGLTAHGRYGLSPVTNDGAGTFTALAGPDSGIATYATWNFGYYIGGANLASYNYKLFYDFDPAAGNLESTHGVISLVGPLLATVATVYQQNSWNLGMSSFLAVAATGVTPPVPSIVFDPNAIGEYTFKLAAYTQTDGGFGYGSEVFNTSMVVNAVPEPGEWAMMLAGLSVVGLIARRRQSRKA